MNDLAKLAQAIKELVATQFDDVWTIYPHLNNAQDLADEVLENQPEDPEE